MLVPIIVAKKSTIEALDMKLLIALPCSFTVTTSAHTQTESKVSGQRKGHDSLQGLSTCFSTSHLPSRTRERRAKKKIRNSPELQRKHAEECSCPCRNKRVDALSVTRAHHASKLSSGGRARTQRSGLREDASNQRAASFSARAHKAKGPLIEGESDGEPRVSGPTHHCP